MTTSEKRAPVLLVTADMLKANMQDFRKAVRDTKRLYRLFAQVWNELP